MWACRLVRLLRLLLHAEGAGQRTHRVDVPNRHRPSLYAALTLSLAGDSAQHTGEWTGAHVNLL